MLVIVKTPHHYYSPFIPIIFAYYVSPITFQYGTKVLILLRNSVKRTISWYSLFYVKMFMKAFNNNTTAVYRIIEHQMNVSLNYEALNKIRNMIIGRNNEQDDILILNEYFKFFYGFARMFKICNDVKFDGDIEPQCIAIDIGLYSKEWNSTEIGYRYMNHVRHLVHMLFVGLSYPHLLLPLSVFKQTGLLGEKFRFMSFNYIVKNSKEALYLMTCWSEGIECDIDGFKRKEKRLWNNIYLPHQKSETLPIPEIVKDKLNEYYEPVIVQINKMLNRFNEFDDIFLGEWRSDDW